MKDVSEDDEDLAACNDAEADSEEDGIDPLCVRYDLELDPTESIRTAWSRLHEETLPSDVTAAQAVGRVVPFLYPPTEIARIGKEEEFKKATKALAAAIKASIRFHTHSGRTSFFQTAMLHSRVLLVHAEDVLPEGYEADSMRELVYSMIAEGVKLARLPATLAAAAKKAESDAVAALKTTPYAQSLSVSKLAAAAKDAEKAIADAIESIEKDAQTGLPAARAALLGTLARNEKVPYYFGVTGTGAADYEAALIGLATEAVRASTGRTPAERLAGATALATYKGRPGADAAIASLVSEITVERVTAKTNAERELVEKLLKALK